MASLKDKSEIMMRRRGSGKDESRSMFVSVFVLKKNLVFIEDEERLHTGTTFHLCCVTRCDFYGKKMKKKNRVISRKIRF